MKKTVFLSFAASLMIAGTTLAYDEHRDDNFRDATTRNGQIASNEKLDAAIKTRQRNYMMEKLRDNARKNIKNQWLRHTLSRAESGINGVSTFADRQGELNTSPYYNKRRATTNSAVTAPNNAKRNFRTRAYDYYIDGGDAGTEVLQQDVILSSEHTVPTRTKFHTKNNASAADIIAAIRKKQKNRKASERVATGTQKTTFRRGDSQRYYLHPYMKFDVNN